MRAPKFWQRVPPDWRAKWLTPLGQIYGAVATRNLATRGVKLTIPVICVGNFTAGGAGKTPTVMALAKMLIAEGENVFVLSRGYGRVGRAAMQVRPEHNAQEVGDEPILLAQIAPTVVAGDRLAGAQLAIANGASVILMDDGLQNSAIARDLTLAVVDGAVGVGNGLCMPAGPLRAPLTAQMSQVDKIIMIGSQKVELNELTGRRFDKPILNAKLVPNAASLAGLSGKKLLAFAGIGRPQKFFDSLQQSQLEVVARREFADHHKFSAAEIADLRAQAVKLGAVLVTTTKDFARLGAPSDMLTLVVALEFEDVAAALVMLRQALLRRRALHS